MTSANDKTSASEAVRGPATEIAVRNIARLKPDHRELLGKLLADPSLSPGTLEIFVEHLLEEEGPALQQLVARTKLGVSAELASSTVRPSATVGDLRGNGFTPHPSAPRGVTVGGLRRG